MALLQSQFESLLKQTDIQIDAAQMQAQLDFLAALVKWNKAYNLTSVRDPQQMLIRHIFDSMVVSAFLPSGRYIDVGTGPGLPAIPLSILMPDSHFTLLDSLGKRVRFQRQVTHELTLNNVESIQSRVEEYHPDKLFDGILSRAFASINDMLNWCQHLGTTFYAMKGQLPEHELATLPDGFAVQQIHPLTVPELDEARHLIIINKLS